MGRRVRGAEGEGEEGKMTHGEIVYSLPNTPNSHHRGELRKELPRRPGLLNADI
jgi:hypothetical protein